MSDIVGSTAQRVRQELERLVETEQGGGRLPPERDLARHFGVARNTLRQALGLMEKEGLLSREVGRGTFLTRGAADAVIQGGPGPLAEASPSDIMEVRQIFEPHAAALAATRADSNDLAKLQRALEESLRAESIETFETWDAEIHYVIFQATKNAVLLHYCDQINEIRRQPTWFNLKKRSLTQDRRKRYDQQHSVLVEAILSRNPEEAYRLSRQHVLEVKQNLLGD